MIDQKYCPCGGIILADTEDWEHPMCNAHYESLGCPAKEPSRWVQRVVLGLQRANEHLPVKTTPGEKK